MREWGNGNILPICTTKVLYIIGLCGKMLSKRKEGIIMGAALGSLSILAFAVFGIISIVKLLRNKDAKKSLRVVVASIFAFIIAIIITPTSETETVSSGQTQQMVSSEEQVEEKSSAPEVSKVTTGQKNALKAAKNYISVMPLSYTGLITQLEFEKYSTQDATYGADNCGADWNKQAEKAAKNYLSTMSFSRDGLIQQLEFEGFTNSQAVHGAEKNGY